MSVNTPITKFNTGTYTVSRNTAGSYQFGILVTDSPTSFDIVASVQPLTGLELQVLSSAHHSENTKKLYTTTELKARDDDNRGDKISIDGGDYEVESVKKFDFIGVVHYKATVTLIVL